MRYFSDLLDFCAIGKLVDLGDFSDMGFVFLFLGELGKIR